MRFGLVFSILLHAAIAAIGAFTIIKVVPLALPQEEIPVEIVTIKDDNNVKAQAPKEETPEPKPEPEAKPPPEPAPAPAPANKPDEAMLEPQEKPKKTEPPKPQDKPKPTAEAKDDKFDPDKIQALLNKAKKDQEKQQKTTQAPAPGGEEKPRPSVGAGTDNSADVTTFIQNSLKRQMAACWSFPAGAAQAENLVIAIHVQLRADGSLIEAPELMDQSRMGEPYYRAAAEAALRAINRCQPFELPAEYYDVWKDIIFNFDPRAMLGQ
jgi:outer membrane biosynthesis protein TonB